MPPFRLPARTGWLLCGMALVIACRSSLAPSDLGYVPETQEPHSAVAFFRHPVLDRVALSPDGERIAGLTMRDGVQVLLETPLFEREIRFLKKIDEPGMWVRTLGWSGDHVIVVGFDRPAAAFADKSLKSRIVALRIDGRRPRDYGKSWPYRTHAGLADGIIHWLPGDPEDVLVNLWQPDGSGASVARVRVRSGYKRSVVPATPFVHTWYADHRGEVRAASGDTPDGTTSMLYGRVSADAPFEALVDTDLVRETHLEFAGYSEDPGVLYLRAVDAAGRKALYEYDLAERRRGALVYAHPEVDVGALIQSPVDGRLWAIEVETDRPRLHFVDEEAARVQAGIDAAFPDTVNRFVGFDRTASRGIVRVSGDTTPPQYYAYDSASRELHFLFAAYPDVDAERLAPTRRVQYVARDGVVIPAYLTLPRGEPAANLPAILIPHDGPSQRNHWGWNPTVQFLASRGFAVFQPDYRGSSGYGLDFAQLGFAQWGLAMQDDLDDGVRWLVAEGLVDAQRVGIYGTGYGGYAALMGLVKSPDLYRAGASYGGVTDLVALLEHPEQYASDDFNRPVVGVLPRHVRQLVATSPARQAERIRSPVLIGHGTEDPIVNVAQAHAMLDALEDVPVAMESVLYRDELNVFFDERNRIHFHQHLADFFERHLGAVEAL